MYIVFIGAIDLQQGTYTESRFDMNAIPFSCPRSSVWAGMLAAAFFLLGSPQLSLTECRAADRVDFEKQILPIFEQKCFECHSGGGKKKPKAGLRLDVAEAIIKGTKREKIIEIYCGLF